MRFPLLLAGLLFATYAYAAPLPWSYDGDEDSQEFWGQLSPDYAACEIGTQQSPVLLSYTKPLSAMPLDIQYKTTKAREQMKDYTLQLLFSGDNTLVDEGTTYHLKEFRIHSPSEHITLDRFHEVEMHLVHEDAQGKKLILAIFAEIGAANPALQQLLDHVPDGKTSVKKLSINLAALLPNELSYYAYTGSLTTPPCTEGIEWRVLKKPITLSKTQLSALVHIIGRNARLPQPIYMRTIRESLR